MPEVKFFKWQGEKTHEGNFHLNGICGFKSQLSQNKVNQVFYKVFGTLDALDWGSLVKEADRVKMFEHCGKAETRDDPNAEPRVYGDFGRYNPNSKRKRDKEGTVANALALIREGGILKAKSYWCDIDGDPKRFNNALEKFKWQQAVRRQERKQEEAGVKKLRLWQEFLKNKLRDHPDSRRVYVVLDRKGNRGKSWFVNWYADCFPETTIALQNGKSADIAMIVGRATNPRVILVDFPRSTDGQINYQVFESIKNGRFLDSKYKSRTIDIDPPHLVFFVNEALQWDKMSRDRYEIINLVDDYCFEHFETLKDYVDAHTQDLLSESSEDARPKKKKRIDYDEPLDLKERKQEV